LRYLAGTGEQLLISAHAAAKRVGHLPKFGFMADVRSMIYWIFV
jgi:hypothetical protein